MTGYTSTGDLQREQKADASLKSVVEWIQQKTRPSWEEVLRFSTETKSYWNQWELLRLNDGLLERWWETPDDLNKYWQLVIPSRMRPDLEEAHNQIASRHLGVKKTLSRLRHRFYWTGMRQDVQEWIRTCDACCAKKGLRRQGCAPLQLY